VLRKSSEIEVAMELEAERESEKMEDCEEGADEVTDGSYNPALTCDSP
jgi:hypothetical protein